MLGLLAGPVTAAGQSVLGMSIARARRATVSYERRYWAGEAVTLQVGHCQRADARQVSCLAEAVKPGQIVLVRDWATRLPGGMIRLHPGSFATITVLEPEANSP
jgi:hypothetical protein